MFSDFKTRGFGLEDSQITRTDRLDRLVLVLALAPPLGGVDRHVAAPPSSAVVIHGMYVMSTTPRPRTPSIGIAAAVTSSSGFLKR